MKRLIPAVSILSLGLLLFAGAVNAQACPSIKFRQAISLPGVTSITEVDCSSIGNYIIDLYTLGVYVAAILAAVVMMVGGFLWLTAGGNSGQISTAKSYLGGALSGFVLILASWVLLNTINPNLTRFKPLNISKIGNVAAPVGVTNQCAPFTEDAIRNMGSEGAQWRPGNSSQCPDMPPPTIGATYSCYCKVATPTASLDDGKDCRGPADCTSLNCKFPPVSTTGVGKCAPTQSDGQACSSPADCNSLNCQAGVCVSAQPFANNQNCRRSDQCASNNCVNFVCVGMLLDNGERCSLPSDCKSASCVCNQAGFDCMCGSR
jgi:hypothetical protein